MRAQCGSNRYILRSTTAAEQLQIVVYLTVTHRTNVGRGHDRADQLPIIELSDQEDWVSITMSLRGGPLGPTWQ